jgi:hypothetical protein
MCQYEKLRFEIARTVNPEFSEKIESFSANHLRRVHLRAREPAIGHVRGERPSLEQL